MFQNWFFFFHVQQSVQYNNLASFNAFNGTVFQFLICHIKNIITTILYNIPGPV